MEPGANTTSAKRKHLMLTANQEELRRAVLSEMRPAGQLANLAGRGASEMRRDLDQWVADCRILSVRHEGVDYFAAFALDPSDGYRPYPVVSHVIQILGRVLKSPWGLASWFIGLNSSLDDQRPRDLLASDPEWVIKAAQDEANESRYPHC